MAVNSPKYRAYFITINESAECYENALEIAKEMKYDLYALIIHDKDIDENGQPKKVHKHLVIELINPISFNSIQKRFNGAHIEPIKYKKSSYQYLIHNSPNSKEKYQYDPNDIISNNLDLVKNIIESEEVEIFNEAKLLQYIAMGIVTQYLFFKHFGLETTKKYWKTYNELSDAVNHVLIAKQQHDELSDADRELLDDYNKAVEALHDLPF